jgi:hypothetical protein
MAAVSRLGRQIEEVIATLNALGTPFALIGGLAPASHKVVRATQDVDLLTDPLAAAENSCRRREIPLIASSVDMSGASGYA